MKHASLPSIGNKILVYGLHLWLTDAMKTMITRKAERLFRHEPRIIRVRIGIGCKHHRTRRKFCALGQINVQGTDLSASVSDTDAYRAIDLLVRRLDRMLRRRSTARRRGRTADDIRTHTIAP